MHHLIVTSLNHFSTNGIALPPVSNTHRTGILSPYSIDEVHNAQKASFDILSGWVVITTLYHLMLQSWYQKTAQSLVNTLSSFFDIYRLPLQQYDLLKTPLITALGAYNSKTAQ